MSVAGAGAAWPARPAAQGSVPEARLFVLQSSDFFTKYQNFAAINLEFLYFYDEMLPF